MLNATLRPSGRFGRDVRQVKIVLAVFCAHVTVPLFRARRKGGQGNITWAQVFSKNEKYFRNTFSLPDVVWPAAAKQ